MPFQIKAIALAAFGLICATGGAYAWHKTHDVQPVDRIVVKEVEKPVFRYIQKPSDTDIDGLKRMRDAELKIFHTEDGSIIRVRATDGYKEAEAALQISEKPNYVGYAIAGVAGITLVAATLYELDKHKIIKIGVAQAKF